MQVKGVQSSSAYSGSNHLFVPVECWIQIQLSLKIEMSRSICVLSNLPLKHWLFFLLELIKGARTAVCFHKQRNQISCRVLNRVDVKAIILKNIAEEPWNACTTEQVVFCPFWWQLRQLWIASITVLLKFVTVIMDPSQYYITSSSSLYLSVMDWAKGEICCTFLQSLKHFDQKVQPKLILLFLIVLLITHVDASHLHLSLEQF